MAIALPTNTSPTSRASSLHRWGCIKAIWPQGRLKRFWIDSGRSDGDGPQPMAGKRQH